MSVIIKHHHQTTKPNDATKDVSSAAWNEEHDVVGLGGLAVVDDAPSDSNPYLRKNAAWVQGLIDAASDGKNYARKNAAWAALGGLAAVDDAPSDSTPYLRRNAAWVRSVLADTAANLAASNPTLLAGQIGYETDKISFKIGDGATAYNSLTYAYRGLPVAGEPSLGTMHPHSSIVINAADPPATGWTTVDISAQIPPGTKLIFCRLEITASLAGVYVIVADTSSRSGAFELIQYTQVAGVRVSVSGYVTLTPARTFAWYASSPGLSYVHAVMQGYLG